MNNLIVLNQNDNVGVSQFIIPEKTKIEGHDISTIDPIPFGHKVCLKSINKGDPIIKYDQIIGFALNNIKPGEHVHSHNLEFREFKRDFKVTNKKNIINEKVDTFFNGILRDNGDVATRNYSIPIDPKGPSKLSLRSNFELFTDIPLYTVRSCDSGAKNFTPA